MPQGWAVIVAALAYLLLLFVVASYGDRKKRLTARRRNRPVIYALSLAVYCTSWTFFGSVGLAAASGLDFLAIYLGPILMITIGYPIMSRIIRVAKAERITSIADFISARYGKSLAVGSFATIIAVVGTVPYIALQLKAISFSVTTMVTYYQPLPVAPDSIFSDTSFVVAIVLALFAILFGTRHADATEHQDGLMLAVAMESLVKLAAFLIVGLFVTYFLFDGLGDLLAKAQQSAYVSKTFSSGINPSNFLVLTLLSFFAAMLLPRQFHVSVVENHSQDELKRAVWLFPLYLVLINLFVVPVALAGMLKFGSSVDADTFVLALPIFENAQWVSMFAFLGGLSAATAMVIVACVALAIMISNAIVLPLILRARAARAISEPNDMGQLLLHIRRGSIFMILLLAYAYFKAAGDSAALASIGLLSFAAVAQFAPAFFGGLIWRRATARGALWGMALGFATWAYTLFLPTLFDPTSAFLVEGPLGIGILRPQALLGFDMSPLTHGVFWSLLANSAAYVLASYSRQPTTLERAQAAVFIPAKGSPVPVMGSWQSELTVDDMKDLVARYLGKERTERSFQAFAENQGQEHLKNGPADTQILRFSEQLLASAIGAASSRLVLSLLLKKHEVSPTEAMQLLDDASEALQHNRDLLQTALDQVDQGISVFDANFRLSFWNRQFRKLLDLPADLGQAGTPLMTITRAVEERADNDYSNSDLGSLSDTLINQRTIWQLKLRNKGRVVEVHSSAMPDGGVVVSWDDITDKVNAAADLQTANETLERRVQERTEALTRLNSDLAEATEAADAANIGKTRFLAAVGHDILQPLNAARLYTSTLIERLDTDRNRELLGHIDDSLDSVDDILGAVMTISRLDTGSLKPRHSVFSLEKMLRQLNVEFLPIAEGKKLKLAVKNCDFHVRTDMGLARRLLQNLISNAIKYTSSGQVCVECTRDGQSILVSITDTGIGIDERNFEKIYAEFHRLEDGKKQAPGLGLGLSIVQRIANVLELPINLQSKPGEGSCFCVTIPYADPVENIALPEEIKHLVPSIALTGLKVLCIDNDQQILRGMDTLLSSWGCEVDTAISGTAAKAVFKSRTHDIILADFHLEHETGIEVVASLRSQAKIEIPAILITADRSADVQSEAARNGMVLLNKPVKPAALRAVLSQSRSRQVAAE